MYISLKNAILTYVRQLSSVTNILYKIEFYIYHLFLRMFGKKGHTIKHKKNSIQHKNKSIHRQNNCISLDFLDTLFLKEPNFNSDKPFTNISLNQLEYVLTEATGNSKVHVTILHNNILLININGKNRQVTVDTKENFFGNQKKRLIFSDTKIIAETSSEFISEINRII